MKCAKDWEKSCPRGVRRRGSWSARRTGFHGLWRGKSVRLANNLDSARYGWNRLSEPPARRKKPCARNARFFRFLKSRALFGALWESPGHPFCPRLSWSKKIYYYLVKKSGLMKRNWSERRPSRSEPPRPKKGQRQRRAPSSTLKRTSALADARNRAAFQRGFAPDPAGNRVWMGTAAKALLFQLFHPPIPRDELQEPSRIWSMCRLRDTACRFQVCWCSSRLRQAVLPISPK